MERKSRILILEDVAADAELEVRTLEDAGIVFESRTVSNEQDFTESLHEFNPDLILADYRLPGFDGLSAMASAQKTVPDVPIIFVSGTIGQELAMETMRRGALDCILKDHLVALTLAVKKAIDISEVQKERERINSTLKAEFEKYRMATEVEHEVHVLMLEDVAADAELVERLLKDGGINLRTHRVTTKEEFMKALELFSPDLILLDYKLPQFSGAEALELAKAEMPRVPCIFVSGSIGEDVVVELLRKGATDYVLKQKLERLVPVARRAIKETTERRKLEQSQELLKHSEENFRQITESINEIFFLFDPIKPEVLYMSPAYEKIYGERPETLYLDPAKWLNFVVEEDKPKMQEGFKMALQDSVGMGTRRDFRITNKRGELRFIHVHLTNVKNSLGEPYRVVGLGEDVTEKVLADAKIEELNKLRNEFVHVVSHQLRTPLTTVQWNLESLGNAARGKLEIDPSTVADAHKAAMRVNSRINDMLIALDVAEGIAVSADKKANSLEDIFGANLKNFMDIAKEKSLFLEYTPPIEKLPAINCNADNMAYVFRKLVENAIVYTRDGGRVTVLLKNLGNVIRFEIADTGIGIPVKDQSRIFSSFFRASNAQAQSPDGSGVSLSILKKYLAGEGGKIGFTSEEGKGSTFWFELPIEAASTNQAKVGTA